MPPSKAPVAKANTDGSILAMRVRADFVVSEERVVLLEVNTLPGFTGTSLYPEASIVNGTPMVELCHHLVTTAWKRGPTRRNEARPLPV